LHLIVATKLCNGIPVGEIACLSSPLPDRAVPVTGCPLGIGTVLKGKRHLRDVFHAAVKLHPPSR
jgi:hypothetical protein